MQLHTAIAFYSLSRESSKWLSSSQLPQIAEQALLDGYDSSSLRILAGEKYPRREESGKLFEEALRELRIPLPNLFDAGRIAAVYYAKQIEEKKLDPYEGAKKIGEISNDVDSLSDDLSPFIGLWSAIDDTYDINAKWSESERVKARQQYIKEILLKSKDLIEKK